MYYDNNAMNLSHYTQKRLADAEIEVQKRKALSMLDEEATKKNAEIRSDVAARKELQQTKIFIAQDGEVRLMRELFTQNAQRSLNVALVDSIRYEPEQNEIGEKILFAKFSRFNRESAEVFIRSDMMSPKKIYEKFMKAGIFFGFTSKREQDVLWELFCTLLQTKKVKKIPLKRGWNIFDGKLTFVFPEMKIWKEVWDDAR